jgi:hypothetical protein
MPARESAVAGRVTGPSGQSRKRRSKHQRRFLPCARGGADLTCSAPRCRGFAATAGKDVPARDSVRVLSVFSVGTKSTPEKREGPKSLVVLSRPLLADPLWEVLLAFDSHPLPPSSPRNLLTRLGRRRNARSSHPRLVRVWCGFSRPDPASPASRNRSARRPRRPSAGRHLRLSVGSGSLSAKGRDDYLDEGHHRRRALVPRSTAPAWRASPTSAPKLQKAIIGVPYRLSKHPEAR